MIFWLIKWIILSFILIFLIHYLYNYLQNIFTVPKVKDFITTPSQRYNELIDNTNIKSNNIKHRLQDNYIKI